MDQKMMESRLRWFNHVQRRTSNAVVRISELIEVEGMKKGQSKAKITLVEVVNNDMSIKKVLESMTLD